MKESFLRMFGILAVSAFALTPGLHAQVSVGPTVGWENDLGVGIGATARAPLASLGEGVGLMADLLLFFPDLGDYFELNGNLTYDFPLEESTVLPFVLAGLTIGRSSVEILGQSVSNTAVRLNVGGGIEFDAGNVRPSAGLRIEFADGDAFVLFVSLPFALGS